MTAEEKQTYEEQLAAPATKADLQSEKWSINLTTLVSTGGAVGTLIVTLLVGGWYFLREARAEGREGAKQETADLRPRVGFLEAEVPFVVTESRETRVEFRAYAAKGPAAVELFRPMAPLPVAPDAGVR